MKLLLNVSSNQSPLLRCVAGKAVAVEVVEAKSQFQNEVHPKEEEEEVRVDVEADAEEPRVDKPKNISSEAFVKSRKFVLPLSIKETLDDG